MHKREYHDTILILLVIKSSHSVTQNKSLVYKFNFAVCLFTELKCRHDKGEQTTLKTGQRHSRNCPAATADERTSHSQLAC